MGEVSHPLFSGNLQLRRLELHTVVISKEDSIAQGHRAGVLCNVGGGGEEWRSENVGVASLSTLSSSPQLNRQKCLVLGTKVGLWLQLVQRKDPGSS